MVSIIIYLLICLLFGAVSCLFGKKLYFPILMLTVFSAVITVSLSIFDLNLKVGIITVLIAAAAALLSRFFYKLGVFLIGCILGGCAGLFAVSFLPASTAQFSWIIILLLAVIAGICALKWCDFFIMASTAFNGAFTLAVIICFLFAEFSNLQNFIYASGAFSTIANLSHYLNNQFPLEHKIPILIITIVIALIGLSFQMFSNIKEAFIKEALK